MKAIDENEEITRNIESWLELHRLFKGSKPDRDRERWAIAQSILWIVEEFVLERAAERICSDCQAKGEHVIDGYKCGFVLNILKPVNWKVKR